MSWLEYILKMHCFYYHENWQFVHPLEEVMPYSVGILIQTSPEIGRPVYYGIRWTGTAIRSISV